MLPGETTHAGASSRPAPRHATGADRYAATRRTGSTGVVGVASQREFVQVEGERSVVVCNRRREFWEWETK